MASTTDEGLEVSRCFADGLFSVSDFDTEKNEEAAKGLQFGLIGRRFKAF